MPAVLRARCLNSDRRRLRAVADILDGRRMLVGLEGACIENLLAKLDSKLEVEVDPCAGVLKLEEGR